MRVLFCNVGWMKYYNGITEDDELKYGGAYVERTGDGGEQYNFMYYNGRYYGYVNTGSTQGLPNKMHIERINGGCTEPDKAENVLVIWTAKDDNNGVKIIGWYENATVYRDYQYFNTIDLPVCEFFYNITAEAENCTLLPVEERTFTVPRARTSKDGIGMGQSNIWYADKYEAREFVKSVVEYVKSYSGKKLNFVPTKEELESITQDDYPTMEEYIKEAEKLEKEGKNIKAIQYCNKVLMVDPNNAEANRCKGKALLNLKMFDEAIIYFNKVLKVDDSNVDIYYDLGLAYGCKGESKKALDYFDKLLSVKDHALARAYKGIILHSLNKKEEGEIEILKALKMVPNQRSIWDIYVSFLNISGFEEGYVPLCW